MSFGMVAASYLGVIGSSGIIQQNFGTWSGAAMSVSLSSPTTPSSVLALFVFGNTIVTTPAGWTLRESQVNMMGHYLFTCSGGANSWNITSNSGVGTWCVVEIANGTYDIGVSANDSGGDAYYTTPSVVPTAGNRLLLASIGSASDEPYQVRTVSGWTNGFSEIVDICNPAADYPMQGVATFEVVADGVVGYATVATYSVNSVGRSAIIAAFSI